MLSQKQIRKRKRVRVPSSPIAASEANSFMRNIVPFLTTAPRPVVNKVLKPMIIEFNKTFETNPNVTKSELRAITKKAEENLNKTKNAPSALRDIIVDYSKFYNPSIPSAIIPNITPLEPEPEPEPEIKLDYAPSINERIINQFTERQPDFAIQAQQTNQGPKSNKLIDLINYYAPAAATTAALLGVAYATSGDKPSVVEKDILPLFQGRHFPTAENRMPQNNAVHRPRILEMEQQIGDSLYNFKVV